jgi:hypothetical protein
VCVHRKVLVWFNLSNWFLRIFYRLVEPEQFNPTDRFLIHSKSNQRRWIKLVLICWAAYNELKDGERIHFTARWLFFFIADMFHFYVHPSVCVQSADSFAFPSSHFENINLYVQYIYYLEIISQQQPHDQNRESHPIISSLIPYRYRNRKRWILTSFTQRDSTFV